MQTIRIGHSPDPDDAFMFYALTAGKVTIPGVTIEHVLEDIESLNRRSRTGELEVTAVSFATYLLIADQYRMMDPGASMGKGYGPILVAREPIPRRRAGDSEVMAIPGKHTTSALLLRLYVGDPPLIEVAFDKIPHAVLRGPGRSRPAHPRGPDHAIRRWGSPRSSTSARAGSATPGCRCPLGCNVMRRDLGEDCTGPSPRGCATPSPGPTRNVDEALEYAMRYGRGIDKETCRRFVLMYVNDYTLALGRDGRAAIERLFSLAHQKGLIPSVPLIDPV